MKILLKHGNGAKETSQLIDSVFMRHFRNSHNAAMEDCAILDIPSENGTKLAFTTDSFVVKPLFFPGSNIGHLAVCGAVNDLLTAGAKPWYISASFIIEEGMDTEMLGQIAASMQTAAQEAGVHIVTGDTKVVEGSGGLYIATSGVGFVHQSPVTIRNAVSGDVLIVTGNLGDHYACILSQRIEIQNDIQSDAAPLVDIVQNLLDNGIPLHGMRDITRGGLAAILHEIAKTTGLQAVICEEQIPVSEGVRGLCAILGLEPINMANEGKMLIIVPKEYESQALQAIQSSKYGENAAVVGSLKSGETNPLCRVVMRTDIGTERIVPMPSGEGLPRIC